jgi:ADP-ribose pyrophosphatase
MKPRWKKTADTTVFDARIFTLNRATFGREGGPEEAAARRPFYYLSSCDWVNVVPITPDRKVVLIRQFRVGVNDFVLETPGGMVDPADPSPLEAAKRELLEETGYSPQEFEPIGRSHPNPATQNNSIWFFAAPEARKSGPQNLDPSEDIEVELVDLLEIDRLIDAGEIDHALVLNAFDFLKRKHPEYWHP